MSALYSRSEKGGQRLLRRSSSGGWKSFDTAIGQWRTLQTKAALELLEHELATGKLVPVAATFLGGEFSA